MKYYVYGHYRATSNEIFYIGKGSGVRHLSCNHRNRYWHFIVNKYGFYSKIFKSFDDEQDAFDFEKILLKKVSKRLKLCNSKPGGAGGKGCKLSPEHKMKISEALKLRIRKKSTYDKISMKLKGQSYKRPRKKGFPSNNRKRVLCISNNMYFDSTHAAGKFFNLPYWNIAAVCRGERKNCGKMQFKYVEGER